MTIATIDNEIQPDYNSFVTLEEFPPATPDEDNNRPLPYPEEELVSLEEFRIHLEKRVFERLGIKLDLSSVDYYTEI